MSRNVRTFLAALVGLWMIVTNAFLVATMSPGGVIMLESFIFGGLVAIVLGRIVRRGP